MKSVRDLNLVSTFLSLKNKLTNKQKQELSSLSIRDKTKDETVYRTRSAFI